MTIFGITFGAKASTHDPWAALRDPAADAVAIEVGPSNLGFPCACGNVETMDIQVKQSNGAVVWMGGCGDCASKIATKAEDVIRGRG